MLENEKMAIVEFLRTTDPTMDLNPNQLTITDAIDLLIEKVTDLDLDYSILSTAFLNKVNPDRFEQFHEAVMNQYDTIADGQEIPETILDRLASQYR
jgi:hypothetical protein